MSRPFFAARIKRLHDVAQLGYAIGALVLNNAAVIADTEGVAKAVDGDVTGVAGNYGNACGDVVYRLREGIERFLITDINNPAASAEAQSTVWMMGDQLGNGGNIDLFNHVPGGCNILFLDGHVDFIRYPSDPPVTRSVAEFIALF